MNTAQQLPKLPPMLVQYREYKGHYPDCLILFQVGDFYEIFFEDALTVARTLNLTLTSRDKNNPEPVPMCGVPVAVVEGYLQRLVAAGYSAAIISQEGSVPAPGKGMVNRSLERIVTPAIKILGNVENAADVDLLAAIYVDTSERGALAFSDVQTGRIVVRDDLSLSELCDGVRRITPSELILPLAIDGRRIDRRTGWVRQIEANTAGVMGKFRGETTALRPYGDIGGYSALSPAAKKAVRLLIGYVDETTVSQRLPFTEVLTATRQDALVIDATTRENLELVRNLKDGSRSGTLYEFMDRTVTAGGSKLLRSRILAPSADLEEISARHAAVRALQRQPQLRTEIAARLKYVTDLERIAARLELVVANPRELAALRDALNLLPIVRAALSGARDTSEWPRLLQEICDQLVSPADLGAMLGTSLVDSPPTSLLEGEIIRAGFNAELDDLRALRSKGRSWIAELESSERARTGIQSLKIKYNGVIGFFIEITAANRAKVPEEYVRRQSTANTERFTTPELRSREQEVLGAESKQFALERRLFEEIRQAARRFSAEIRAIAAALSALDLHVALADLAESEALVEPRLSDSLDLEIVDGRHPIVARVLAHQFVPNSLQFRPQACRVVVLTGPNMGGKSTYLRQAALIVVMAQLGSFVPAKSAAIGLVDRIFARLGASDNLREGESTFMVEMREASHIVAQASERSLVLIDEIGRGTATADGLAIARAILEWIVVKVGCRALFATHFHELTQLAACYETVTNLSVGSVERDGEVFFTHQICPGAASGSYGIEVAKLAGLPQPLIDRARELLRETSRGSGRKGTIEQEAASQLTIFTSPTKPPTKPAGNCRGELQSANDNDLPVRPFSAIPDDYLALKELEKRIAGLDPNNLTPRAALDWLFALRSTVTPRDE